MAPTIKKLLLGAAFLLPVAALADQYPNSAGSTRTTVTVNVVWLPTTKLVSAVCAFLMEKPASDSIQYLACYNPKTATIYAVEPRSFNDIQHLETLGHEFWHALGAVHPED